LKTLHFFQWKMPEKQTTFFTVNCAGKNWICQPVYDPSEWQVFNSLHVHFFSHFFSPLFRCTLPFTALFSSGIHFWPQFKPTVAFL
jgi:hypothetical protein